MQQSLLFWGLLLVLVVLGGYFGASLNRQASFADSASLIHQYYALENAVSVSPHGLRKRMDAGDVSFVLVDLRSKEEYEAGHIIGAVNIPAYRDKETSAYGDVDRIVSSFRDFPEDVEIITYCYSVPCMTSRKVGKMLAEHGVYVKHLNVGWNEWRYFWHLWNHEHELQDTSPLQYVMKGSEPGSLSGNHRLLLPQGCVDGLFGC